MRKNALGKARLQQQIAWNRLISIVEEQAQVLVRTAFSTSVREAGDLSAGVFDTHGRMLAQARTGTPGHVNAMAASVAHFLARYPWSGIRHGDVFVTNDPWLGTGHLNDFTVVTPVFRAGVPLGLFAATSHVADVGGLGFGSDGTQVFEEGVQVPPMHLIEADTINTTLLTLLRANVRAPYELEGDLHSLAACNAVGARRLIEVLDDLHMDDLQDIATYVIDTSRAAMLAQLRELPFGTYTNEMTIDGAEHPVVLRAALSIGEPGIEIDFSGTSPASSLGINVPMCYTSALASFGVRCVIGGSIPNNSGSLAPIKVAAPLGSILNAPRPCAVSARHVVGQMLPDVVLGCLAQACPERVPAEGTSCLWILAFMGGSGIAGSGTESDGAFVLSSFHNGGTGARPGKDGLSATAFPSGVRSPSIEINETVAPLVFRRKEYRTDSGGPGRFRGGLGQVIEVGHLNGAAFAVSALFDRVDHAARGRFGGAAGAAGRVRCVQGLQLAAKGRQVIARGDSVVFETPGGGGLGRSQDRLYEAILSDVANELVTRQAAQADYGVSISEADISRWRRRWLHLPP